MFTKTIGIFVLLCELSYANVGVEDYFGHPYCKDGPMFPVTVWLRVSRLIFHWTEHEIDQDSISLHATGFKRPINTLFSKSFATANQKDPMLRQISKNLRRATTREQALYTSDL